MCHGTQTAKRLLSTLLPDFGEMNLFILFSPFSLILDILNKGGKGESSSNCSILAHTDMVSSTSAYADKLSSNVTSNEKSVDTTIRLISDIPTATEMNMMACLLSGKDSSMQEFKHELKTSCYNPKEQTLKNNMPHISKNGLCLQIDNLLIPCNHL